MKALRVKAGLLLAAVFLLGGLAGAGAGYGYAQRDCEELMTGGPERAEERRARALTRELSLDREQQARVREIFAAHREERHRVMRETDERCGGAMRAHKARLHAAIRAILRPEQQRRLEELVERHEARGRGGGRGPGPHGGPP